MNKRENCQSCLYWTSSIRYKDMFSHDLQGVCNRHTCGDGNAEAICSGEGISGELITRYNFGCNEYKYDEIYKQRKLNEDWEYYQDEERWKEIREANELVMAKKKEESREEEVARRILEYESLKLKEESKK